ncbi:MAG: DeoR/GlpR family DNA-binding transcription regulator [Collinsella bouchesdurhonensis]
MFPEERHALICSLIDKNGRVTVTDLARRFDVTEDCIRKDLKQLAANGKCQRVYGGATRTQNGEERNVVKRLTMFQPEKQTIAHKALEFIEPKQIIYLDISSTNLYLAQLIAQSDIACTVVSPMIDILTALATTSNVTAICPGGTISAELNGFVGAVAVDALKRFRFEMAFIGAYGVDSESREVTTYDADDGLLKRCAIECAGRSYLVCESRKFSTLGNYHFASFEDFDALICDDEDIAAIEQVQAAGLDVL